MRVLSVGRAGLFASLGVLLVVVMCIRFGFWQLDRLSQRRDRNRAALARLAESPINMKSLSLDSSGLIFRTVQLSGRLDGPRTIILPGHSLRGVPGVHVLTPMRVGAAAVLINRGWMPSADGVTIQLDSMRADSSLSLRGIVLPFPASARKQAAASDSFKRVWFQVDPAALKRQFPYRLADYQVQALPSAEARRTDAAAATAAAPIRLQPPALSDGPHLGYAIQWFSFAAIGVIGWLVLVLRSRHA